MKNLVLSISVLMLGANAALAQTVVADGNGDGVFSMEEMLVAYPDLTVVDFGQIDVDGSGAVDADELQAAREQGLIES